MYLMTDSSEKLNFTQAKFLYILMLQQQCLNGNFSRDVIQEPNGTDGVLKCPRIFDGFTCWDPAPALTTVYQQCPKFVVDFNPKQFVYKNCMENGAWHVNSKSNELWTDYKPCRSVEDLEAIQLRSLINNVYISGYTISVIALIISIIVFFYFMNPSCIRTCIDVQLFASHAMNNMLWIVWYCYVSNNFAAVQKKEWCKWLNVITNYFMVCSYFLTYCEGIHLHSAVVQVFMQNEVTLRVSIMLAWGVSALAVIFYAFFRYITRGANERCWADYHNISMILFVPVGISLVATFGLLINVVRVLLTQLRPTPNQTVAIAARKTAKAAAILKNVFEIQKNPFPLPPAAAALCNTIFVRASFMPGIRRTRQTVNLDTASLAIVENFGMTLSIEIPIFTINYVLLLFRPSPDTSGKNIYQDVFTAVLTSFQGLCVAILFCLTNHGVMVAMKACFSRFCRNENRRDCFAITGNIIPCVTVGEGLVNTRDHGI